MPSVPSLLQIIGGLVVAVCVITILKASMGFGMPSDPMRQGGAMAFGWVLAVIVGLAGVWLVLVHTGITSCPSSLTGVITRVACPS